MAVTSPGAVDYHLAIQAGTLAINQVTPFTISCWINAQVWTGGNRTSMVGFYTNATTGGSGIQVGTGAGTGSLDVWYWGGTILVSSTGGTGVTSLTNGVWYHIAYTYDGTTHRLYVNGAITNTSVVAQSTGTSNTVFVNGYPTGGANETGLFTVDDFYIYNRALSANEISTQYATAGDCAGLWYGLQCNNRFGEGTGTASNCIDYSGHSNGLTPMGAATGVNFVYSTSATYNDLRPAQ